MAKSKPYDTEHPCGESYMYTLSPRAREHFGHNRKGRNHVRNAP
jgi:hypothetical protein